MKFSNLKSFQEFVRVNIGGKQEMKSEFLIEIKNTAHQAEEEIQYQLQESAA